MSGTSGNKLYKHPQASEISGQPKDSTDNLIWEMRNYRHFYRNRTPNLTPSSTVLNSPDIDDIKIIDQYQKVTSDNSNDSNGLRVLDSQASGNNYPENDIVIFDDIEDSRGASWMNPQSRLVTGSSPTSSHSSNSGNASGGTDGSKSRIIGGLHIADLQGSPRRFGNNIHGNNQPSPPGRTDKNQASLRAAAHSPGFFPKRTPGFPKVRASSNSI